MNFDRQKVARAEREFMDGFFTRTSNVETADAVIDTVQKRNKQETGGLIYVLGEPGVGKSRYLKAKSAKCGWVYLELPASAGVRTIITTIADRIAMVKNIDAMDKRGPAAELQIELLNYIKLHNPTIVLDEVGMMLKREVTRELIKYLADNTQIEIILAGMTKDLGRIEKLDKHFRDRCTYIRFNRLTVNDFGRIYKENQTKLGVVLDSSAIELLHKICSGNLRQYMRALATARVIAKTLMIEGVSADIITKHRHLFPEAEAKEVKNARIA